MIAGNIPGCAATGQLSDHVAPAKWPLAALAHAVVVLLAIASAWSTDETAMAPVTGTPPPEVKAMERTTRGQGLELRQLGPNDSPVFTTAVCLNDTILYLPIVPDMRIATAGPLHRSCQPCRNQ